MNALPPGIDLVRAPNPGPLTGPGTNSWVFGSGEVVVIDPGPLDKGHLDRLAEVAGGRGRVAAVLCTHHHVDHQEGAEQFALMMDAPLGVFHRRADRAGVLPLEHRDEVLAGETSLTVLHTPGHSRDHLCFLASEERVLFTGDHVLSGTTSVIWPPDGEMAEYLRSLVAIQDLPVDWLLPGHGEPIPEPAAAVRRLLAHRREREAQVLRALATGPRTPEELVRDLYRDYPQDVREAAAQTVLAHCLKLEAEGQLVRATAADGAVAFGPAVP